MKSKLFLILFLIGFVGLSADNGYNVNYSRLSSAEHQLEFQITDFRLIETIKDGTTFSSIEFEGGVNTNKAGWAQLPYLSASVQLQNKNVSLLVTDFSYEEFDLNYPMLPSRGIIYRNQDPSLIPYQIDPSSIINEFYPENLADTNDPFIIRSVRGISVYSYPFQYNAARNVLRIYTSMTVKLIENDTPVINPLPAHTSRITREMHFLYSTAFINYEISRFDNELDQYGSILVIYTARDEDAIAPWVQWKREKGFVVYEELVATGTNVTSLVQNTYNANNDILYVQLVGDWADIQGPTSSGSPTDPNIGCVVGTDVYPDLIVGRFSANNATHVTTQVNKSITYEQTPQTGASWYSAAIGIASNQGPGDDNEYDNVHIQNIYDNKLQPFTYNTHTPIYDPTANASMVGNAVNAGASIINYTGHGSETSWGSSGFSNTHVNLLTNGEMLPFIISVACVNGSFHNAECFAEAWLKKENAGAVGFYGSTVNQSWNPPMRGQDYINDLLIGGYDYSLYAGQSGITTDVQKTTYGAMCINGSILMTLEEYSGGAGEMKFWTIFGDASLQVRTDTPAALTLSNNAVLMGVSYTTIVSANGSPVAGALVSLYQDGDVYTGLTDPTGSVTIQHALVAGTAKLTVTSFNTDTIYEDISVIPPGGPYVMLESFQIDDSAGNNNGLLDYSETISLDVTLINVGTDPASSLTTVLLSTDPYLTIIDNNQNYAAIPAGQTATQTGAYTIEIDQSVPDLHNVALELHITDGVDVWQSNFSIMAHAPVLVLGSFIIDDTTYGNGDYFWDAGEAVELIVNINNNGSADAYNALAELSSNDPYITISAGSSTVGDINYGTSGEAVFSAISSPSTPQAYLANFLVQFSADLGISGSGTFATQIGGYLIEEYFATFPPDGWTVTGGSNWQGGTGNNAGGTAPEARFYWSPSTTAVQRLVSYVINTSGSSSLQLQFKHNLDHYGGPYSVKVQTTSDGNTWNDAWSIVNPTGNVGPELIELDVSTPDVGSPTFQIAWVFDGYSWNVNNWYVDDVILGGGSAATGFIEGNVTLVGGSGNVQDVEIFAGGITTHPDASGNYSLELIAGVSYNVQASLAGYASVVIENILVEENTTTANVDFTLQAVAGPTNLTAEIIAVNDVILNWTAPDNGSDRNMMSSSKARDTRYNLEGYKIYRNNIEIAEITNPNTLEYTDTSLDGGEYTYCVSAVYDIGESDFSNDEIVNVVLIAPQDLAAESAGDDIILTWSSPVGTRSLSSFKVYRNNVLLAENVEELTYTDINVPAGSYSYQVSAVYGGGYESPLSDPATIEHTEAGNTLIPLQTELLGNYPNPFNPSTTIKFALSAAERVTIDIYNIRGEKVITLLDETKEPGYYSIEWNGKDTFGRNIASGVYFFNMRSGSRYTSTRKMIMLK
jgi:hypothetical protein